MTRTIPVNRTTYTTSGRKWSRIYSIVSGMRVRLYIETNFAESGLSAVAKTVIMIS